MIRRAGLAALLAAVVGVAVAVAALNYVALLGAFAIFVFLAAEIVGFHADRPSPDPAELAVTVVAGYPKLPIGAEAPVRLRVTNRSDRRVRGELVDTLPPGVRVVAGRPSRPVDLPPGASAELAYRLRAPARGRRDLGPTRLVVDGPLGLAFDELPLAASRPLLVTASNPSMRSSPAGFALYSRVRGRLALRHRGFGTEFRSLREYDLSDDIRHVAWRRSTPERLLVREFEQESRQDYLLAMDLTAPMDAGAPGPTPLDRAAEAAAVVAGFIERAAEDRVGLLTYSDRVVQYFRPSRGSAHFRRLADNLALLAPRPGRFDLADLLEQARRRLSVHTHLLVFSALADPLGDLHGAHRRFVGRGHHLYAFVAPPGDFHPDPDDAAGRASWAWARHVEAARLHRRLALLTAEGIPSYRYDRHGATAKVLSAYGEIRAWGRTA